MSFVPAIIDHAGKSDDAHGSGIKVGIRGRVTPRLFIKIARSVGSELGLTDGAPIEVLIGEGEHHGLIRFRKHEAGLAYIEDTSTKANGHFQIRLGRQLKYVARSEAPQTCQWRHIDGFIELKLPVWAAETGPNRVSSKASDALKAKERPKAPDLLNVRVEEQRPERPLPKRSVTVRDMEVAQPVVKRVPAKPNPLPLHAFKKQVTQSTFRNPRAQETTRSLLGDPAPGRSALDQRDGGK